MIRSKTSIPYWLARYGFTGVTEENARRWRAQGGRRIAHDGTVVTSCFDGCLPDPALEFFIDADEALWLADHLDAAAEALGDA